MKAASEFLSMQLPISAIGQFSLVIPLKYTQYHTSWAVYGTNFRITAGFQSNRLDFDCRIQLLKRVPERIFTISRRFQRRK